ncbi:MAG TPA: hypothetical protein PK598_06200 [Thermoanaerobaculia bacterium]|nr:hypothetical protein [Thermoanaerobaculia bacterium]
MPRPVGTDRLEVAPEGALVLYAERPKGWRERRPAARTAAEHPGTAVLWEGELWEVTSAVELPGGGARYELRRWDERHAARHVETYDAPREALRGEARAADRRRGRGWLQAFLFSPLLGHLPSGVQERIENETAFSAPTMTIVSAVPLFVFGIVSLVSLLSSGAGGAAFFPVWVSVLGVYLLAESGARLAVAVTQGRPAGSFAGEILATLVRAAGGGGAERSFWQTEAPDAETSVRDGYRVREPLFALLSAEEQKRAADDFGFDPVRWGRVSAVFLLGALGPMFVASLLALLILPEPADVLLFLLLGVLVAEQVGRLRRLARREAAPSVLRFAVRPFCARFLGPGSGPPPA